MFGFKINQSYRSSRVHILLMNYGSQGIFSPVVIKHVQLRVVDYNWDVVQIRLFVGFNTLY